MTFTAFTTEMDRLAGLKFRPANLQTHWEALSDLADAELDAAITRAQRECEEFPAPKMIRAFVDDFRGRAPVPPQEARFGRARKKVFQLPDGTELKIDREWTYYCDECSDCGWRSQWCGATKSPRYPWLDRMRCERKNEHDDHEWAGPCPCAATNPDVLRRIARAQQVVRKQTHERG